MAWSAQLCRAEPTDCAGQYLCYPAARTHRARFRLLYVSPINRVLSTDLGADEAESQIVIAELHVISVMLSAAKHLDADQRLSRRCFTAFSMTMILHRIAENIVMLSPS